MLIFVNLALFKAFALGNSVGKLALFLIVGAIVENGKAVELDRISACGEKAVSALLFVFSNALDFKLYGILNTLRHERSHKAAPDEVIKLILVARKALLNGLGSKAHC